MNLTIHGATGSLENVIDLNPNPLLETTPLSRIIDSSPPPKSDCSDKLVTKHTITWDALVNRHKVFALQYSIATCCCCAVMVYITPLDQTVPGRSSYGDAYNKILAAHRRSPLTSASSVVMLVAPDVDALCASKMLSRLFRQDDVIYTIIPVAGVEDFTRIRDELMQNNEVREPADFLG